MNIRELLVSEEVPAWLKQTLQDIEESCDCEEEEGKEYIKDTLIAFFDIFNEVSEQYMVEDILPKVSEEIQIFKFLKYVDKDMSYIGMGVEDSEVESFTSIYKILYKAYFIWILDVASIAIGNYKKRKGKNQWIIQ